MSQVATQTVFITPLVRAAFCLSVKYNVSGSGGRKRPLVARLPLIWVGPSPQAGLPGMRRKRG